MNEFIRDHVRKLRQNMPDAEQLQYDEKRSAFLKSQGYRVIRFWNTDVFKQTQAVLNTILNALNENI